MRIFLIFPPVTVKAQESVPRNCYPPLGLGYLAAILEKYGHKVEILDAFTTRPHEALICGENATYGLDDASIKKRIADFKPDVVGISSMYTMYSRDAHRMARLAKEIDKNILVVFGGAHASCSPQSVLSDVNVDIAVIGEGENTFLEVVDSFKKGLRLDIAGTAVKKNGSVHINAARPLIEDLDELPFPARHILPMEDYFYNASRATLYNMRNPFTTLLTSRGCPMHCVYCAVKTIWGMTWRSRSPVKVVDEIQHLVKDYSVREIHFSDDNISVDKNRLVNICQEIMNRKLNVRWAAPTGVAIWSLDEDILKTIKKAGCYRLTFGLESGNRKTLDFIGKKYSYDKARQVIRLANRLGFWTASTFIFGFPDEAQESINDTINLALNSELDFSVFYTPVIFPGTRLFDVYEQAGIAYQPEITGVDNAYNSLHFSKDQLLKMRNDANSLFIKKTLLMPFKFLSKVRNIEDLLYVSKIGFTFLRNLLANYTNKNNAFGLLHRTAKN